MRLPVTQEELKFLQQIGVEDREYTPAELEEYVIETVADYLQMHGFVSVQENTNEIGDMCEAIIDKIAESLE